MQKHLAIIINVDWYFNLHWYNRAKAAKEKGYRVSIITSFTAPRLKLQWESEGYDCYDIKISRSGILIFEEVASIYHLYKIIKKIKPDLVHSVTIKPNIYTGLISKALKIPCVKSITGLGVVFSNNSYKFRAIKTVIVLLYKYIGRTNQGPFLFENSEDKLLFQRNGIGRSDQLIQVNGAGVDTNKYQSRKEILTEPQITVLFAARLLKDKGLDTLISSINHCRQIGMDIRLIVAGIFDLESNNAYSQDEVEYLSQKHDFNWVGTIEDMPSLMNNVDIVALPTRYGEGIPRVLIEAGAMKRLVVTTNVAGCRDLIRNACNGWLIEPYDSERLAEILVTTGKNRNEACFIASNLYKEVVEQYSDEVIVQQLLGIYESTYQLT